MLVLLKNVKIANIDIAVRGTVQIECSLCDDAGDRNLAYNVNNVSSLWFDGKDDDDDDDKWSKNIDKRR